MIQYDKYKGQQQIVDCEEFDLMMNIKSILHNIIYIMHMYNYYYL